MEYIFIIGDLNANIVFYKFGQTGVSLTVMDPKIILFLGQREHKHNLGQSIYSQFSLISPTFVAFKICSTIHVLLAYGLHYDISFFIFSV